MIGLSNSVHINNSFPIELALPKVSPSRDYMVVLHTNRNPLYQIGLNHLSGLGLIKLILILSLVLKVISIVYAYYDIYIFYIFLETLNAKNFNAQTVQSHLNLVSCLVVHNKNAFQLQHMVVLLLSLIGLVSSPLPSSLLARSVTFYFDAKAYNAFTEKCKRCISGDTSTFELLTERPSMQFGLKIGAKDLPHPLAFPAMDLCIEYKGDITIQRDHFEGYYYTLCYCCLLMSLLQTYCLASCGK